MNDDFNYFSKEDLFPTDTFRPPEERVSAHFRSVSSLPPLAYLTRLEDVRALKQRGLQLQDLTRRYLSLPEYGFLTGTLGPSFGKFLRMPLEFRDLDSEEFEDYFVRNLDKFKERISMLRENAEALGTYTLNRPPEDESDNGANPFVPHVVSLLDDRFKFAGKGKIIAIYDRVKENGYHYPAGFFNPRNRRLARILVQHLVDDVLQMPHRKVGVDLKREAFDEHKLGLLLDTYYEGSVDRAISDAYPRGRFDDIHNPDFRPDDPVEEVLKGLEAY